jgi:hypothetical protein
MGWRDATVGRTSHALAGASQRGGARLRRCLWRPGPGTGRGLFWGGRPAGGQGEFGNFDFPVISGHFGPLYLTVGGGCGVRVGFAARRSWLVAVIRHFTRSGLSGGLDLFLAIWGAVGHVFIIVQVFC